MLDRALRRGGQAGIVTTFFRKLAHQRSGRDAAMHRLPRHEQRSEVGGIVDLLKDQILAALLMGVVLTSPAYGAPATTAQPMQGLNPVALLRNMQTELKRVGCYNGIIDGVWGPDLRQALLEFAEVTGIPVNLQAPTEDALSAVAAYQGPVCVMPRLHDP